MKIGTVCSLEIDQLLPDYTASHLEDNTLLSHCREMVKPHMDTIIWTFCKTGMHVVKWKDRTF